MEKERLSWENVVRFASDTANVMVRACNSVLSRLLEKQPNIFSLGCLFHLANLCSAAALKKLPFSIDNLLIDIFYHFKHSSKKWESFFVIVSEFEDIPLLRVLKHCTTRWLSLLHCLDRLLEQWPALHMYFDRQAECEPRNDRVQCVANFLRSTEMKLICIFVTSALRPLNKFNTLFQTN